MGNYASFCIFDNSNSSPSRIAKLLDAHGNLQAVKVPINAAELMVEEPGHVVAPVDELRRTRSIVAVKADDELLAGKIYLLVSISRVNCKVSELEMAIIESACKKKWKKNSAKVLPAAETAEEGGDLVRVLEGKDNGFSAHQLGKYRLWNPVLEPIYEEF